MYLKSIELSGFKSFAKKDVLTFTSPISGIVGPNGSGKSNVAEAFSFVLGEQSMKSMRGKRGEDLIFNGSTSVRRANRASVKIFFDNSDRFLDVDYDEVLIERVVHRDGVNQYTINGSNVRLRDIIELLAAANIGSSGHHIISQGEADRILNSNIKERREIIEDALGLKVFQYKKQESEKKLSRTEENIAQIVSLRKEVSPHLRFLEKQIKKIEKAFTLRDELRILYGEYLKREHEYIKYKKSYIEKEKTPLIIKLKKLEENLKGVKEILKEGDNEDEKSKDIVELEENISQLRKEKDIKSREIGRIEGQISFERRRLDRENKSIKEGENKSIPLKEIELLFEDIKENIKETEDQNDLTKIKLVLKWIADLLKDFIDNKKSAHNKFHLDEKELSSLEEEKKKLNAEFEKIIKREEELNKKYNFLRKEIESVKNEERVIERKVFEIMAEQNNIELKLTNVKALEERILIEDGDFKREVSEAGVLIGTAIASFMDIEIENEKGEKISSEEIVKEEREKQEERRRALEKIKIRLEDVGGGSVDEIMNEYKEVKERDEFFEHELEDLDKSALALRQLIKDLEEKLDVKFKEGVSKINITFQKFFSLLFDGGTANLVIAKLEKKRKHDEDLNIEVEQEDEDIYEGIEVKVNLPQKRVRGLEMLSGGERALTSIALLFAMSQVNPPPFIILDETDAALDEANSRKYGDMIENLSKKSQLILITHNRETMSRAGILYGITMGSDGVSKILSVKLEEAVAVAK